MQDDSASSGPLKRTAPPDHITFGKTEIEQSIPDRFESQVVIHAERNAISDGGHLVSYTRLHKQSNQIAHMILEARGDSEEPVAFLLDQGAASIISILGILKAGKIYVPLDPVLPMPELVQVVTDCQPSMIVTNSRHVSLAYDLAPTGALCLNLETVSTNTCDDNPSVTLGPDRAAYIYYTSGSTGSPKGVVDCHRNVLHNIMRYTNSLGIAKSDRLSLVQSCSFSGTVSSLFSALLNGATICPFDLRSKGFERLANWVDRERVTIFHSVPVIFEHLLANGNCFDSLRIIRLEGDQAYRRHVDLFQKNFENRCVLVNGLGTTETGIIRQYGIDTESRLRRDIVPVGYPVEDMQISLLDDAGAPVADGAVGEINVRSRYLAKGYWGRADLTRQSFRHDSEDADRRVYATGDLGRFLPDNCLEYLGRKDLRIKLRGQTIDVARIEETLRALPSVTQAAVVAHDNGGGYQQLVAYLVAAEAPAISISALRRTLSESLPEIMLPARFVFLDELPVDWHNKVARRFLPRPNRKRPLLDQDFVAPISPRQQALAECFSEILGIDEVGLNDDFLDLGGDSLKATELMLVIERKLGVYCPAEDFFRGRTVAALDRDLQIGGSQAIAVPIQPRGTRLPLFCLHNHAGHILEYQQLAQLLGPDQPVFGIQSTANESCMDFRLEDMAARYIREIQQVQPNGPYNLCGNCFGGLVAFEVAQQLRQKGEEIAVLALIDTASPIGTFTRLNRRLGLRRNWRELSQLPAKNRFSSLGGKLARFSSWIAGRVKRRMQFGAAKRFRSLTPPMRREHLSTIDSHREIERRYRPRPYGGQMTLICTSVKENQLGWARIGGQRLNVVRLSNQDSGYSNPHLVEAPYVESLAGELSKLLGAQDTIG